MAWEHTLETKILGLEGTCLSCAHSVWTKDLLEPEEPSTAYNGYRRVWR